MAFTEEQLRILDCIAAGLPVRAAREAIAALRLKADFLLSKPPALLDNRVAIQVVSPYAEEPAPALPAAAATVGALPDGQLPAEDDAPPFEDEEGEP